MKITSLSRPPLPNTEDIVYEGVFRTPKGEWELYVPLWSKYSYESVGDTSSDVPFLDSGERLSVVL